MRKTNSLMGRLLRGAAVAFVALFGTASHAAAPGITGSTGTGTATFNLSAAPGYISQPDGTSVYSWGYGCASTFAPGFLPGTITGASCPTMQLPGPTLIVNQGDAVTVTLTNNLPAAAGNTSILFPGFAVTASGGTPGVLTQEAPTGGSVAVTYTFVADKAGTHSYYSGTQGDLQVEMGLYGALIVLPTTIPTNCQNTPNDTARGTDRGGGAQSDFRLAKAAFNHSSACYDREYLFQISEMDIEVHRQAEAQKDVSCAQATGCMIVSTEPYVPTYFMINGRSMPDLMEPNYALHFPNQPYNANPHMHPGELTLLRIIGTGRWQHPFHEHGNHVRILARDGNLITTATNKLAGPLLFTTTTTPGMTMDGIYQWTGKGLNWDAYGHANGITTETCVPDANGYYTSAPTANNYYEWCADHLKPLEDKPFGQVGKGGPVTLPDPNIFAFGPWYSGSPYLGPDATARAVGATPVPPSGTVGNAGDEAGFFFMWHSHNEREITTNNAFPGGMLMMMGVDPWVYVIDETK